MDAIRITELPSKTYVEQGDYMAIDNQNSGTKKVQFTNLLDSNLSAQNKAADALATGQAINGLNTNVNNAHARISDTNARIDNLINSGYTFKTIDTALTFSQSSTDQHWVASGSIPVTIDGAKIYDFILVDAREGYIQDGTFAGSDDGVQITMPIASSQTDMQYFVDTGTSHYTGHYLRVVIAVGTIIDANAEITDARLGATILGGKQYNLLGNAIRGQATDIVNDLDYITGTKRINMTSGGYIGIKVAVGASVSMTPVSSSSHSYAIVPCVEGNVFFINARGTSVGLAVGFVDSNNKLIVRCGEAKTFSNVLISAPANSAYLILNTYSDGTQRVSYKGAGLSNFEPVSNIEATNGYYINKNDGSTWQSANHCVTGYIPVMGNALYSASMVELEGNASICEYDGSRKFIRATAASVSSGGLRFRTTKNTVYVRMSGLTNLTPQLGEVLNVYNNSIRINELTPTNEEVSFTGNPLHIEGISDLGLITSVSDYDEDTLITACGKNIFNIPQAKTVTKNNVTFTYDNVEKSIRVQSDGATANTVSGSAGTVNGASLEFDFKFRFKSGRFITLTSNCSEFIDYNPSIYMQLFSGSAVINAENGQGFSRYAVGGLEYACRIAVRAGWSGDVTFYPQIELSEYPTPFEKYTGVTAYVSNRQNLKSIKGVTNIFTNDDSTITAITKLMSAPEKAESVTPIAEAVYQLNPNVEHPYEKISKQGGQICFIDDDTTSLALVRRYHDLFDGLDAVGNYAVMTFRLDEDPNLKTELLNYEKEGFGMLYHINYQMGASTEYFLPDPDKRDMAQAEDNFVTGLRKMQEAGFVNYRYWVSPYGVNDYDMQRLAKRHGMHCLLSTGNNSLINRSNADRWNIPRYGFATNVDNTQSLKDALDVCYNRNELMIVTTHVNNWNSTDIDERFKSFVAYCINMGVKVVSFPEAFATRYPMFLLNELF